MGSIIGKSMDENMAKQQKFMLETQVMQMERQIQMQNQMRERMMAMQIGRTRDLFMWFGTFYSVAAVGLILGFKKTRRPGLVAPLVPLTFILCYQYDMAYGNKMERIRAEADRIMDNEGIMLELPHGVPTFASIEASRLRQHDKERLSQSHDLFL